MSDSDESISLFCPFEGMRVVVDPIKGRCLETLVPRQTGELIFVEDALVYSNFVERSNDEMDQSDDEQSDTDMDDGAVDNIKTDQHINGPLLLRALGKKVFAMLDDIHNELSALEKVDCLDTARNFVQLVAISHLHDNLITEPNGAWTESLELLAQLKPGIHMGTLLQCVRSFRASYPRVFPISQSDEQLATHLGILNTNQVELEDYGGSGLFVGTAIIEHSCAFNCSYTTKGSTLYMTATRPIAVGERLSIDYGNHFYSPTIARKVSLFESYGFLCSCPMCVGDAESAADRKRAFWCANCRQQGKVGIICPIGPLGSSLREALASKATAADAAKIKSGTVTKSKKGKGGGKKKSTSKSTGAISTTTQNTEEDTEFTPSEAAEIDAGDLADCLEAERLRFSCCSACSTAPDQKYVKECLRSEEYYRQNPPETFPEITIVLNDLDCLLHESHYILFQCADIISQELTDQARRFCDSDIGFGDGVGKGKARKQTAAQRQHSYFEPALQAMQHCCRLMDQVLPLVHQEKVVFYDRLGQLAVCAGQKDFARVAFGSAYQMSVLASGVEAPQTVQLSALVENTPASREELMQVYAMTA